MGTHETSLSTNLVEARRGGKHKIKKSPKEASEAFAQAKGTMIPADTTLRAQFKLKCTCPDYHENAWGKPDLNLICGHCGKPNKLIRLRLAV